MTTRRVAYWHDGYGIVGGAWIEEDVDDDAPEEREERDERRRDRQRREQS
jgi:hypothetical protein